MAISKKLMVPFAPVHLDRRSRVPLQRQLYNEIRGLILNGRLPSGSRLPATRLLATDLAVSRNTVTGAFDQLLAEGYLQGRVGSGTYVADTVPEELLRVRGARPDGAPAGKPAPPLSERGRALANIPVSLTRGMGSAQAFRSGVPALDQFPRELWARLAARLIRHAPSAILTYGDPAGYRPLRQALTEYVRTARGVRCSAEQIIVTAGSQQALDLAARVLLDPGDTAWVEDPGYLGARGALRAAGIRCAPIPVDSEGIDIERGEERAPEARLACVTPSHQYPLGIAMPAARRMRLLEWARRRGAWIVEDDFDSEFRYAGRPVAALQGLDTAGRVIYTGSFSKVLFPAIRLGYLIVPEPLVDAFGAARALADRHSAGIEQVLATEFLAEGHFARHVRRMRMLYAERQQALVAAAGRELAGVLEVAPAEAGIHLVGWAAEQADDQVMAERARAAGVITAPVSALCGGSARASWTPVGICVCESAADSGGCAKVGGGAEAVPTSNLTATRPARPHVIMVVVGTNVQISGGQLISERIASQDWQTLWKEVDSHGCAVLAQVLSPEECAALRDRYRHDEFFRSRVVMAKHGFGRGEYKYFAYPLPEAVQVLRESLYPQLAEVANRWNETMGIDVRYPGEHAAFLERCHAAGQTKPTPLLLEYGAEDYNCLHQDIYGEHIFPLQVAILLSAPGQDFTGGEFVLTEQRPRMQSRAEVVPLAQGDGVVFPVHHRPVAGKRGSYRVNLRHGVSRVRSGRRYTLGVIFHDAA